VSDEVLSRHLLRRVVVRPRQSDPRQVEEHPESTPCRNAFRRRPDNLCWSEHAMSCARYGRYGRRFTPEDVRVVRRRQLIVQVPDGLLAGATRRRTGMGAPGGVTTPRGRREADAADGAFGPRSRGPREAGEGRPYAPREGRQMTASCGRAPKIAYYVSRGPSCPPTGPRIAYYAMGLGQPARRRVCRRPAANVPSGFEQQRRQHVQAERDGAEARGGPRGVWAAGRKSGGGQP